MCAALNITDDETGDGTVFSGFLQKRGVGMGGSGWKQRFFVLETNQLDTELKYVIGLEPPWRIILGWNSIFFALFLVSPPPVIQQVLHERADRIRYKRTAQGDNQHAGSLVDLERFSWCAFAMLKNGALPVELVRHLV